MRSGERFAAECGRTCPKDPIRRLNAAAGRAVREVLCVATGTQGQGPAEEKVYRHRQLNAEVDAADIPALACAAPATARGYSW